MNPHFIPGAAARRRRRGLLARFVDLVVEWLQDDGDSSWVFSGIDLTDLSLDQIDHIFSCDRLPIGGRLPRDCRQVSDVHEKLERLRTSTAWSTFPT
jgi:hypothetical protein